ncbi:MAG: NAD(+)/NADH kinase [Armatimonadetes bacterium]|nr:NAD(+)/NADH kinase [Armatimonadota bacterium]
MTEPPRVVGVLSSGHRQDALAAAARAVEYLEQQGIEVRLAPATATALGRPAPEADGYVQVDLLLVFGGDGTVISALRAASGPSTPVLGVNYGTFGFLTEVDAADLDAGLAQIAAGQYTIEPRLMLEAMIEGREGQATVAVAANDVVVKASDPTHVLEFDIQADGAILADFPADGVILSTPTGSTAYSLSAGGPVLVPEVPALVLTPICPHTLAVRPIVLPDTMTICIRVTAIGANRQAMVSLDGRLNFDLLPGACLTVRRAAQRMLMARLHGSSFLDRLRGKLRWGKPK